MYERMPPRLTIDPKERQQTLDVAELTASRQRQNGRLVQMLINEPVGVIQQGQTLAADAHAQGNATHNNLQEFTRTLRQPGNVTQSKLQAPNPFPLDSERVGMKLHANELTVSIGPTLLMDLKTEVSDVC